MYIRTQAALRLRTEQNINFADAVVKIDKKQHQIDNVSLRIDASYSSKVKTGLNDQTEIVNPSIDLQTTTNADLQTTTNAEITSSSKTSTDDLVKGFLSFDDKDYQVINKCNSEEDVVEEFDPIVKLKMSFVLRVLSIIDKAESRGHAQFLISKLASELLFENKIEIRCKSW